MNTEQEPLVSIVTPVHNEVEYLAECIESILAQTYQNWDYTIIDNRSTDGSFEVACRYAAKDKRIRVHQNVELLAAIPNHNATLRLISPESKYCKVVFGDDWIFPNCLEQMVSLAEANPSVGIVGAYSVEGQRVAWTGLPYPSPIVSGREICRRHLLEGLHVFGSANAVLYRAELVRSHDPFYNEANIHADTEVCFILLKTWDFGFVHQILTFTRVRPASLSTITTDLHSYFASLLQLLVVHGPTYLTNDEHGALLARHVSEYYKFLGKCLFQVRNKQFWDYHRSGFAKAGVSFSRIRLVRGVLEAVYEAAANPRNTVQRLLQVHKRKRSTSDLGGPRRGSAATAIKQVPNQKATQAGQASWE